MMTIVTALTILLCCVTALVVPWLGVVAYYVFSVGQLSLLFPEWFGVDARPSLYLFLATIAGLGLATATKQVDYRRLFQFPNLLVFLLVIWVNLSFKFNIYQGYEHIAVAALSPADMVVTFNKIVLFYFVAALLIDTRFKLITLIVAIGLMLLVYTLWANKIYVTGEFWRFGDNGRLNGPKGSYHDENSLAMLLLLATPIFYYLSVGTSSRIIRYGLWICIPFTWHGIFLTGSRGAMASLGVVALYIFFRSYSKKASVVFVLALVVAIVDQSGLLLERVSNTINAEEIEDDRAFLRQTESEPVVEEVVDPRVTAWLVGIEMAKDYPLFGVGPGNYMRAYPEYTETVPRVAHNTLIQFAANCGIVAALIYVFFGLLRMKNAFSKPDPNKLYPRGLHRDYLDDLINSTFVAFYCVAFFLDLMVFELMYLVFLIAFCKYSLDRRKKRSFGGLIDSIYRWKQGEDRTETRLSVGGAATLPPRNIREDVRADSDVTEEDDPVIPNNKRPNQYIRQAS